MGDTHVALKDGNSVASAIFESSTQTGVILRGKIDPATGRILVVGAGGGTGTVTEVDTGTGLTGGPITTTGTISLDTKLAPLDTLGTPLQYVRVNAGATALEYATLPAAGTGTVTTVSVVSANGFAGTVANATTTPAITMQTSINAPALAGNGTAIAAATTTGTGSTVVLSASPALTGTPTAPTQATGDNTTAIATDAFVTTAIANAIAGVNPATAVAYATTAAGDTSGLTYSNGVSGIGATLTGANNTAVTIDGHTFVVGDVGISRLLVKNDTQSPSGAFNGVYLFTALQTIGTGAIFTRALDYDTPSDINNTGAIPVVNGTANADTSWLLTSNITTVGTSPLTYTQFTLNPTTLVVGPASATSGVPALFNGTTGKLIQNSTPTGTGNPVMQTSPSLTTPTLGVATATSINKMAITAPATSSTLAIADGKTLTASNTITLAAGADSQTFTFPAATATIAGLGTTQTFTGQDKFNNIIDVNNAVTVTSNAGTVPVTFRLNTFTNSSAATMAITMATASAVDGQMTIVRIYDFSAVAQTIGWTNTENSTVSAPLTSNGSTTLPLTVGFMYNTQTSKWRCIASA